MAWNVAGCFTCKQNAPSEHWDVLWDALRHHPEITQAVLEVGLDSHCVGPSGDAALCQCGHVLRGAVGRAADFCDEHATAGASGFLGWV